jgi:hypothetical protein
MNRMAARTRLNPPDIAPNTVIRIAVLLQGCGMRQPGSTEMTGPFDVLALVRALR